MAKSRAKSRRKTQRLNTTPHMRHFHASHRDVAMIPDQNADVVLNHRIVANSVKTQHATYSTTCPAVFYPGSVEDTFDYAATWTNTTVSQWYGVYDHPDWSAISGQTWRYRVSAAHVTITYIGKLADAQGTLRIYRFPEQQPAVTWTMDERYRVASIPMTELATSPIHINCKIANTEEWRSYRRTGATTTDQARSFGCYLIAADGQATGSASVFEIEYAQDLELHLQEDALFHPPTAISFADHRAMDAIINVQAVTPHVVPQQVAEGPGYKDYLSQLWKWFYDTYGDKAKKVILDKLSTAAAPTQLSLPTGAKTPLLGYGSAMW